MVRMKTAIKIGPQGGIEILQKSQAQYVEVWFRLDWQKQYTPLFEYMKKKQIAFGLHFWAMIKGKYFPNLLGLHQDIAKQTYQLIKETIDIAQKWQAQYVTFHPESYRLNLLDLDHCKIKTVNPEEKIDRKKSFSQLLVYLKKIREYAGQRKIIPFCETVPKYALGDYKDLEKGRLDVQPCEGLETEKFFKLAQLGFPICLDLGHTMGQLITEDKDKLFAYLYETAKKMLAAIGLLHITTNTPPFNGTDSHQGVLPKDFVQGTAPNKKQLLKLLALFKNKDVWLVPEPPKGEMIANYLVLKQMVEEIEGN